MCNPIPIVRSGWILRHALTGSKNHLSYYDFKHLTEKYFEIGMKLDDFLIQLVKYWTGSWNHLASFRFQTFNRKVFWNRNEARWFSDPVSEVLRLNKALNDREQEIGRKLTREKILSIYCEIDEELCRTCLTRREK